MGCKIKRIYLCLLIMSIYLCGCHTEENKDKLCLEKENHSIENTEEIFETNEAISEMEEIIEACIYEHSFTKYENGEWIIYECEPVEGIANNEKDLYVWDNQSNYYSKVIYKGDNFLADIEVKENGIWNWLDNGVTGYTLEVLEWSGNALIPVYTEIYEPEESNE